MTPEELAAAIKETVVEGTITIYRQLLVADRQHTTDEHWKALHALYDSLNDEQRTVLVSAVRQACIDACSTILSVFDNVTTLRKIEPSFEIRHADQPVSGDLQGLFLAAIEDGLADRPAHIGSEV